MNIALIFAGGRGSRMTIADRPKQFLEINGKAILCYTVEHFEKHSSIDGIIVVTTADWLEYTKRILSGYSKLLSVIVGGDTALNSQYLGLEETTKFVKDDDAVVLIHDGVRPLIDEQIITDCIQSVKEKGNGIATAPAIETIIRIDDNGNITETLDRTHCQLARAPQAFYLKDILGIHRKSIEEGKHNFIDSATMMRAYGFTLHSVCGSADNIKVTTTTDFYICETMLLKGRKDR